MSETAALHAKEVVRRLLQEAMTDGALDPKKAESILHEWEAEIRAKPHMVKIPSIGEVTG